MKRSDLDEFVACFNPANRQQRKALWSEKKPDGRWRAYEYDELVARDKCSLDLFWLKDESLWGLRGRLAGMAFDPAVCTGKPCIRNLRFPVSRLLGFSRRARRPKKS